MKKIDMEELKRNANELLEEPLQALEPLCVKTKTNGNVVIISEAYYKRIMEELDLDNNPSLKTKLQQNLVPDLEDFVIKGNKLVKYKGKAKNIFVPNVVTEIADNAFEKLNFIENITLPESVIKIGKYAFKECTKLRKIFIPKTLEEIGEYAFYHCKNLQKIHIPEGIKIIDDCTFEGCEALSKVKLPDSIEEIKFNAFKDCGEIEKIDIPDSLRYIEGGAFENAGITSLKFDSYAEVDSSAFWGCPLWTIYGYKDTSIEEYADHNAIDFEEL